MLCFGALCRPGILYSQSFFSRELPARRRREQGNDDAGSETEADFGTAKQLPGPSPGSCSVSSSTFLTSAMPPEAGGCRFVPSSIGVLLRTALRKGTGRAWPDPRGCICEQNLDGTDVRHFTGARAQAKRRWAAAQPACCSPRGRCPCTSPLLVAPGAGRRQRSSHGHRTRHFGQGSFPFLL